MTRKGTFVYNSLTSGLRELLPKIDAAVDLVFDRYVAEAETHMRTNAPWRDDTGNARAGLFAQHDSEPMVEHSLTLYHTMPYGYWLEIRWSGKHAIIGPTMLDLAPRMAGDLASAIRRATS